MSTSMSEFFWFRRKMAYSTRFSNMKPLRFIKARGFQVTTLKMVATSVEKNDFAVSLNLSDTYFHIDVAKAHRHFLCFKFQGKLFQFKAMPFDLCSPTVHEDDVSHFHVLQTPWVHIIFYLGDTIILTIYRALATEHHNFVMNLLVKLGYLINLEKSDLSPSEQFSFLGLLWDSALYTVALTEGKLLKHQRETCCLLVASRVSCLDVQSFLGLSNFASFAVPRAQLNSRAIHSCFSKVYKSPSYCSRICQLSSDAREELAWLVLFHSAPKL